LIGKIKIMSNLKVIIIQSPLFWEDIEKNIKMFSQKLDKMKKETDLVVLPEMFTTGFSKNAETLAETMSGKTVNFLKYYSKKLKTAICGSVIIRSGNRYYNRLILCTPDRRIYHYDKRHLFSMAKENKIYTNGNKQLIVKIKNWRVAFFICYDLRFPVWCRNRNDYDVAVFSANWPKERNYFWKNLLLARAIENQCYVVGVNRTGTDKNGYEYFGDSSVISPLGKYLVEAKNKDGIFYAELDNKILNNYRKNFPAFKDADKFKIIL